MERGEKLVVVEAKMMTSEKIDFEHVYADVRVALTVNNAWLSILACFVREEIRSNVFEGGYEPCLVGKRGTSIVVVIILTPILLQWFGTVWTN